MTCWSRLSVNFCTCRMWPDAVVTHFEGPRRPTKNNSSQTNVFSGRITNILRNNMPSVARKSGLNMKIGCVEVGWKILSTGCSQTEIHYFWAQKYRSWCGNLSKTQETGFNHSVWQNCGHSCELRLEIQLLSSKHGYMYSTVHVLVLRVQKNP